MGEELVFIVIASRNCPNDSWITGHRSEPLSRIYGMVILVLAAEPVGHDKPLNQYTSAAKQTPTG